MPHHYFFSTVPQKDDRGDDDAFEVLADAVGITNKNEPPLCGRRVEGFGQATKPDAPQPQGLNCFDQMLHQI
jgi:hypothetical protein